VLALLRGCLLLPVPKAAQSEDPTMPPALQRSSLTRISVMGPMRLSSCSTSKLGRAMFGIGTFEYVFHICRWGRGDSRKDDLQAYSLSSSKLLEARTSTTTCTCDHMC